MSCSPATETATAPNGAVGTPGPAATWHAWRGPAGDGVSPEGLVDARGVGALLGDPAWTLALPGRGTPVVFDGPDGPTGVALGTRGAGADLQEVVVAFDPRTGAERWARGFSDFISDIIYERYSIGAPAIDPATGRIVVTTSPGLVVALSPRGDVLWQRSMMEELGRLTFPNGRTGAPVLTEGLAIVRGVTTNWGAEGPARDRFYALDLDTGEVVWSSTPGTGPIDSSFSTPTLGDHAGRRVFYAGTGCGHIVCVDVRTGEPLWRFKMSHGGVNATPLVVPDALGGGLVAIHGKENLDSSKLGRMVRLDAMGALPMGSGPAVLGAEHEVWRRDTGHFTSSGVLADGVVHQMTPTGELVAVDVSDGRELWTAKLGNEQLHASPLRVGEWLFVPVMSGELVALRPTREGPGPLHTVALEGQCIGSPSVAGGMLFVHTTSKLYAFGEWSGGAPAVAAPVPAGSGEAAALQAVPAELVLRAGASARVRGWLQDATGLRVGQATALSAETTGPVTVAADGPDLRLDAAPDAQGWAGVVKIRSGTLVDTVRVRVFPPLPIRQDFEAIALDKPARPESSGSPPGPWAFPPATWVSAKLKWEVVELEGSKVLAKTLDRVLFQRSMPFVGMAGQSGLRVSADVRSDGNRRGMGTVGVVNQRYIIALKGGWQQLEIQSNHDRVKHAVPFRWKPNRWYRLVTEVDVAEDGSGVVRAKAWPRDEPEPEAWTIAFEHALAHREGAPGLFGFSPQSKYRVYVDDLTIERMGEPMGEHAGGSR